MTICLIDVCFEKLMKFKDKPCYYFRSQTLSTVDPLLNILSYLRQVQSIDSFSELQTIPVNSTIVLVFEDTSEHASLLSQIKFLSESNKVHTLVLNRKSPLDKILSFPIPLRILTNQLKPE